MLKVLGIQFLSVLYLLKIEEELSSFDEWKNPSVVWVNPSSTKWIIFDSYLKIWKYSGNILLFREFQKQVAFLTNKIIMSDLKRQLSLLLESILAVDAMMSLLCSKHITGRWNKLNSKLELEWIIFYSNWMFSIHRRSTCLKDLSYPIRIIDYSFNFRLKNKFNLFFQCFVFVS